MFDQPKLRLADVLMASSSMATFAFAVFEEAQRGQMRREFWTAMRRYRLRVEATARVMIEREGATIQ